MCRGAVVCPFHGSRVPLFRQAPCTSHDVYLLWRFSWCGGAPHHVEQHDQWPTRLRKRRSRQRRTHRRALVDRLSIDENETAALRISRRLSRCCQKVWPRQCVRLWMSWVGHVYPLNDCVTLLTPACVAFPSLSWRFSIPCFISSSTL